MGYEPVGLRACDKCHGTGTIREKVGYSGESYTCYTEHYACEACNGSGFVPALRGTDSTKAKS